MAFFFVKKKLGENKRSKKVEKAGHKCFVDLRILLLLERSYVTAASSYF